MADCREHLARDRLPAVVAFVAELRETATGKIGKDERREEHRDDEQRRIG